VNQYYKTEFGLLALEAEITKVLPITEKKILADALQTCLQNPENSYNLILELKSLEGKLKGNKWELKAIINQEGEVEEMVLVGYDISEQLENLARTKKLLEITSLQNTRLQNFTYIVSHNIRSHTANLSGLISFIQKTTSDKEKDYFFSLLKSTTEKLDETITNLNEVISINKNTSKLREKLNLKKEVEKTLDIVSVSIHSKNIKIKNYLIGNEFVPAIPAYLDSILLNLISNAIKYRDPQRNLFIQIDAEQTDGYLKLMIQDNGLGIDMNRNASKLFGMYKTFHENEDARGLRLFLTKNQVEAMNGRIEVLSEVGKGSTFIIYFDENF
jgi:signal transduction histidine kinase